MSAGRDMSAEQEIGRTEPLTGFTVRRPIGWRNEGSGTGQVTALGQHECPALASQQLTRG